MFHVKHVPCSATNSDQDHPADRRQRQAQHAIRDEELLPVYFEYQEDGISTTDAIKAEYPELPALETYDELLAAIKAAL